MGWVKYSTVGATWNSDIGSQPADTAITNSRIKMKVDGTLDYTNANEGTPSLASIAGIVTKAGGGFGENVATKTGVVRFASGTPNYDTTLPTSYGGTGAANLNAVQNSRITTAANGTLKYDNTTAVAPSIANIPGIVPKTGGGLGEDVSAANGAVSFSSGTLNTGTLPAGIGGTGLTATTTLLNASITVNSSTGKLENIGTANVVVNNTKQLYAEIGDTKPPTDATKGAVIGTNMYDTNGSTALDADDLKNGNITLHADGYLVNAGTGTTKLSNEKIAEADLVGSGKTFAAGQKPNKAALTGDNLVLDGSSAGAVKNTALVLAATGVLTGGGTSVQVNIGNIAASNFDTAGDLTGDLNLKSALTIPAVAGNKIICGNITIDGQYGRIVITD